MRHFRVFLALAVLTALGSASAARAETYRFTASDGTVHFTNAPTDPRYQRLGAASSGTTTGWLRLPGPTLAPYTQEIRHAAERHGVPERLISALIRIESGFNPRAISPKGARGLMQLMPQTASGLGVRNSFDPRENIEGGVRHLRSLIERFRHDMPLAVAAYNAGEQAVITHRGIPPYPETRDYVNRVLNLAYGAVYDHSTGLSVPVATATYRRIERDGTVVYTNIRPRGL